MLVSIFGRSASFAAMFATGLLTLVSTAGAASAETPYMASAHAQCPTGVNCKVTFRKIAAGQRLDVQFIGCEFSSDGNPSAVNARGRISTRQDGQTITLPLPGGPAVGWSVVESPSVSQFSTSLLFFVEGGERFDLIFWPNSGHFDSMDCTATGQLRQIADTPAQYMATAHAACPDGVNCLVTFPKIAASNYVDARFVGCEVRGANVEGTRGMLQATKRKKVRSMPLPGGAAQGQWQDFFQFSNPVSFSTLPGESLSIVIWSPNKGMDCTVTGYLLP